MAELPPPNSATLDAIYGAYESKRSSEWFGSLGMSSLGNECDRAIWYSWRKASAPESLDGRKARLFQTGHREEARLIDDLRRAGLRVFDTDAATGKQFKVSDYGGHLSGRLDGKCIGVKEAPSTWHVLEAKTHNEKSFKSLVKDGVEKSKPGHFAQMQLYMHYESALDRSLYIAANKNDEGLYVERVRYDPSKALPIIARVERILQAARPPAKLHEDPTSKAAFACGWCPSRAICHEGEFARSHCRTCLHCTPILDAANDRAPWRCDLHGRELSQQDQQAGCPAHLFIPDLVPGRQIDADPDTGTVTYAMDDGTTWTDGALDGEIEQGRAA